MLPLTAEAVSSRADYLGLRRSAFPSMNSGLRRCFVCSFLAKSKVQAFATAKLKVIAGTNSSPGCSMVIMITVNRVLFIARFLNCCGISGIKSRDVLL